MAPLADDEDMTELVDFDPSRVDAVGKAANGHRFLIAKQAADSRGLVPPELVRDLIAKAEPDSGRERVAMPNGITLNGSPADIAAFIHKAAVRATEDEVAKAKNDTADRKHKAATGAAMPDGSYPIADVGDLTKAIHAVGRGGSSHDAIRRHIITRARSLGASSKIPDNWNSDGSLKGDVSKEAGVPDTVTKDMGPDLDDGVDGMDPTVALAEPDEMAPGDMTDPGSPAWESIDAATAQKWTSIAVRLKNALCVLAEREMLEAASADPDDCENAFDLQDAMCAVDYVIDTLAGFAVDEQAEADLGGEAMEAVGKSAAPVETLAAIRKAMDGADLTATALTQVETFGAVIAKSGRVLSSVNEAHIREAAARLNTVLSSLPQAPAPDDGQPVAKMTPEVEADMPKPALSEDVTAASGQEPAMGVSEPPPAAQTAEITKTADAPPEAAEVAKDDGGKTPMMVVYNQAGKLVGICDPSDITPVANAEADADDDMDSGDADGDAAAAPADAATDMTPQPPAATGTPADAVADDNVTKATTDLTTTVTADVLESIVAKAIAAALGEQPPAQDVAKQADVAGLLEQVETLKARLATVEEQPAMPKVFTNGQVPPAHQLRGQDQGAAPQVDVAKALDLKHKMYTADPGEAKQIHDDLNQMAMDQLAAIHRR